MRKELKITDFRKEFKFAMNKDGCPFDRLSKKNRYNFDFDVYLPTKGMNLQRPLVWTLLQKQQFIISILKGCPIPKITVIRHDPDESRKNAVYQVIDGKQRLTTYMSFIDDEFPIEYNGEEYYFKDLNDDLKYEIDSRFSFRGDLGYSYWDAPISDDDKITWFNQINFAGTPQDQEHMEKLLKSQK